MGSLKWVSNKGTIGDQNISFTKFSQRCFKNELSKVYKIVVYKMVGSQHYVPVVL
jgi:hypothetical protein